jgi:hypothetical protein
MPGTKLRTWRERQGNLYEANQGRAKLYPGNEADPQDMWALFYDDSATALTLKVHDDSADTNSESATIATVSTSQAEGASHHPFDAALRPSDGHLIVAVWTELDSATGDFRVFDLDGTASIVEKTALATDTDDSYHPAVYIDPSGAIYVAYIGKLDGSETLGTTVGVYYRKSTDGGTTWGAETLYSTGPGFYRGAWTPAGGPRFLVGWRDATASDLLTNFDNSIAHVIPGVVASYANFPKHVLRRG